MARPGLDKNAKFKVLIRRLGIPKPYVRGLLETLWDVAHECGDPTIGDEGAVEAAAEWPGEPGVFFAALREGRWIEELPDGRWQIHDYYDHAPEYARKRLDRETARRDAGKSLSQVRADAARKRWQGRPASGVQTDASDCRLQTDEVQTDANGCRLQPFGMQTAANVMQTAANGTRPAPAPAPKNTPPQPPKGGRGGCRPFRRACGRRKFERAWGDWLAHRREIRKPVKPTSAGKQLSMLAALGAERAVACIDETIAKGWTGLQFAARETPPAGSTPRDGNPLEPQDPTPRRWPRAAVDELVKRLNPPPGGDNNHTPERRPP